MEDVLELYAEPYDPAYPLVCFDESPYQMISETRVPVPVEQGSPSGSIMNTNAKARVTCLCSSSRWADGGMSRSRSVELPRSMLTV